MTLLIDVHEPEAAERILGTSVPVQVASLNQDLYADYAWESCTGEQVHVERKTWGELIGDIDRVEDQIRRHLSDKPEARLIFLLEGMAVADMMGTRVLRPSSNGTMWVTGQTTVMRISLFYSWLYQIGQYVEVVQVPDWSATCTALIAMYKSDQKEVHNTLQRYFKPSTFTPDFRVAQLIGLMDGLGEVRAKALIDHFGTTWNVLNASPKELQRVPGIGPALSVALLRKVGRADV